VAKKDETVDQEHAWSLSVRTASTYIEARMLFSLDTRRAVFQIVAHTVHDGYRSACDVFETSEPSGERYCCQDLFEKLACLLDYRGWHTTAFKWRWILTVSSCNVRLTLSGNLGGLRRSQ
jgi:hypothetical protein